jgi:hypothetical protein
MQRNGQKQKRDKKNRRSKDKILTACFELPLLRNARKIKKKRGTLCLSIPYYLAAIWQIYAASIAPLLTFNSPKQPTTNNFFLQRPLTWC